MDTRFTDDLPEPFGFSPQPGGTPAGTSPLQLYPSPSVAPLTLPSLANSVDLEPEDTEDQSTLTLLSKLDHCQLRLKKIHETQVTTLQNMTKALDAISQALPLPDTKKKKRPHRDCIDHDSVAFKTIYAVFSQTNTNLALHFKEQEEKLDQELAANTNRNKAYVQTRKNSLYRRRDAYMLSEAVANCSKVIKNQTQQLQATIVEIQKQQEEIKQELEPRKKQRLTAATTEEPHSTQATSPLVASPPFLLGSPSAFFNFPRTPIGTEGKIEFVSTLTL